MNNFKDQLMTALHDAVGYFNESQDPNAAVTKSASEHDFNAEQTARLVETFNTARTIYHYKTAADRSTSFALADRDVVLPQLFNVPTETKTASAEADYAWYDKRIGNCRDDMEKAAEAEPVEEGRSIEAIAREAQTVMQTQRRMVKFAEEEGRICGVKAADTLHKLASDLKRMWADEARPRYARLTAACEGTELGPIAVKLAEFLGKAYGDVTDELKQVKRAHVIDDRDLEPEFELLKEAHVWLQEESNMLALAGQTLKEADAFEREYLEAISPIFRTAPNTDDIAGFIHPQLKAAASESKTPQGQDGIDLFGDPYKSETTSGGTSKTPGSPGVASMLSTSVFEGVKKPFNNLVETGLDKAFTAPRETENKALSERLKNVQRQIMLQDLLVNDPVLSEEAPEQVANAYSAIMQLAPEVASNKEIVRSILRQTVTSVAVSPYDAELWTKLEGNIRGLRGKGMVPQQPGKGGKQ